MDGFFRQPVQIGRQAPRDGQGDDLGKLVGMQFGDPLFERRVVCRARLDQQRNLRCRFDDALPAVDRLHTRQEVDAGGETFFDDGQGDSVGDGFVGTVGQDEQVFHRRILLEQAAPGQAQGDGEGDGAGRQQHADVQRRVGRPLPGEQRTDQRDTLGQR
ncbi:hypothetical protein SDC9_166380 [bioreactor metagenome]|uniref:Uncharacterized protein n=1 Tax=bioreactor metagenome TaxID=1076179 RepID=A0A645G4E5_9ZZZZ